MEKPVLSVPDFILNGVRKEIASLLAQDNEVWIYGLNFLELYFIMTILTFNLAELKTEISANNRTNVDGIIGCHSVNFWIWTITGSDLGKLFCNLGAIVKNYTKLTSDDLDNLPLTISNIFSDGPSWKKGIREEQVDSDVTARKTMLRGESRSIAGKLQMIPMHKPHSMIKGMSIGIKDIGIDSIFNNLDVDLTKFIDKEKCINSIRSIPLANNGHFFFG